jgi:hypothetical protein
VSESRPTGDHGTAELHRSILVPDLRVNDDASDAASVDCEASYDVYIGAEWGIVRDCMSAVFRLVPKEVDLSIGTSDESNGGWTRE